MKKHDKIIKRRILNRYRKAIEKFQEIPEKNSVMDNLEKIYNLCYSSVSKFF